LRKLPDFPAATFWFFYAVVHNLRAAKTCYVLAAMSSNFMLLKVLTGMLLYMS